MHLSEEIYLYILFKVKSVTQIELSEEIKCIYVSGFVSDRIRNKLELYFRIENRSCCFLFFVFLCVCVLLVPHLIYT